MTTGHVRGRFVDPRLKPLRGELDFQLTAPVRNPDDTPPSTTVGRARVCLDSDGTINVELRVGRYRVRHLVEGCTLADEYVDVTTAHTRDAPLDLERERPRTTPAPSYLEAVRLAAGGILVTSWYADGRLVVPEREDDAEGQFAGVSRRS